jgi:hypothetical protein
LCRSRVPNAPGDDCNRPQYEPADINQQILSWFGVRRGCPSVVRR